MIILVGKRHFIHTVIEFLYSLVLKENITFIDLACYDQMILDAEYKLQRLQHTFDTMPDDVPNLYFFKVDAAHSEAKREVNNLVAAKEYYDTCHKYIF